MRPPTRPFPVSILLSLLLLLVLVCPPMPLRAGDWPAWRGPGGMGVAEGEHGLPEQWSATEHVTWKADLPGPGNSSPVVWGDRVFLTCAEKEGAVRGVLCFDRNDGRLLWRRDTPFEGKETTHETNPYCSASPVTDGKRVIAWHGSAGVVAYGMHGRPLWHRDLGPFNHIWGNGSSPILDGERVFLYCGPGPETTMLALDAATGETLWTNDLEDARAEKPDQWKGSWATPVLRHVAGERYELLVSLPGYVAGFDPDSGKEVWRCRGLGDLVYASPLTDGDTIVAMSGYGGPAIGLRAPQAGETGDLTDTHRLWVVAKNQQRVGSGVIVRDHVYILNDPGMAECIEAHTGKTVWKTRASGTSWGSMVYADGKLYVTDQEGETVVTRPNPHKLEVIATNELGETSRASPAVSNGQIFLRTYKHLYCVGERRRG